MPACTGTGTWGGYLLAHAPASGAIEFRNFSSILQENIVPILMSHSTLELRPSEVRIAAS